MSISKITRSINSKVRGTLRICEKKYLVSISTFGYGCVNVFSSIYVNTPIFQKRLVRFALKLEDVLGIMYK